MYGNLEFLDFSANINPLGPPQGVFAAINRELGKIIHYPDPCGTELKFALSKRLGISTDNLILGNGAVELIYLLAHALKPAQALIPAPTFSEYTRALQAVGTKIRYHMLSPSQNFNLIHEYLDLASYDILVLCNPNNPTGYYLPEEDFAKILEKAAKHGTFVVVDESFVDFIEPSMQWRALTHLKHYDRLFILYSLTKIFAIPGIRLGCGIGNPALIQQLAGLKDPWNVNSLALAAGVAALQDQAYIARSRELIAQEREYLVKELSNIPGLHPFPGAANFLLVHNCTPVAGRALVDSLGAKGVLIRDCSNFPGLGKNYFRIAVKSREENQRLVEVLHEVINPK